MSRATSGLAISVDRSAIRFSSSDISASIASGARGLLIILTREDPLPDADEAALCFLRRDPSGDKDWPGFVFPSRDLPSNAGGINFIPSRVDGSADISLDFPLLLPPFIRAVRPS